jgi:hypothetical protein
MEGTFTKPMPTTDGKEIRPLESHLRLRCAKISHWNNKGVTDEDYLFSDNDR